MARTSIFSDGTPSSISSSRITSARFSDSRRESEPLSPFGPPKAWSCTRLAPAFSELLSDAARACTAFTSEFAGLLAPAANGTLAWIDRPASIAGGGVVLAGGGAALAVRVGLAGAGFAGLAGAGPDGKPASRAALSSGRDARSEAPPVAVDAGAGVAAG